MQSLSYLEPLVAKIHRLRNTDLPSRIILPRNRSCEDPDEPIGVLLLKPSSGYFPPDTVHEILERLVQRHHYQIRSVVWWNGCDIRAKKIMSLHYPGFYRIAHSGFGALAPAAQAVLRNCYGNGEAFRVSFGAPFDLGLVQTSYDLIEQGMSPERLNDLWEWDRSKETDPLKRVQKLDDDGRCLALALADEESLPTPARQRPVLLLNGFFAKLEKDFEARGCVAILIQRESTSATSWEDLRNNYAGKTNPFQAPVGTIRGDAASGALKVETMSILANVIHLSATEAEGQCEAENVWWNPKLLSSAVVS